MTVLGIFGCGLRLLDSRVYMGRLLLAWPVIGSDILVIIRLGFFFGFLFKSNCRYNKVIYECVNWAVMQNATLLMNKVIK